MISKNSQSQTKRLFSIQILRVIACLGVFIVHFGQRVNLSGTVRTITDFGRYGVQLFFIISGFLAAKTLVNPDVRITTYYKKRMIHILSLYYLVILWYFITENIMNHYFFHIPIDETGLGWFRYVFLLNGFVNNDTYFWSNLGITWTIPIFCFFYLIAPWIIRRIKNCKQSFVLLVAIILLSKAVTLFYACSIFENITYFFIGITAFFFFKDNKPLYGILISQILSILCIIFNDILYAYSFIFVGILLLMVTIENDIYVTPFICKTVNMIDEHSYTLYLVHGVVFCSLIDRLGTFSIPNFVVGIIAISLSFVGTFIIHRWIEIPIHKYLTKKLI